MSKIGNKVIDMVDHGYDMEDITNGQIELDSANMANN